MNVSWRHLLVAASACLLLTTGCEDRDPTELEIARLSTDPVVFEDDYGQGIYFQPFFETHYLAASVDSVFAFGELATYGARSLKIEVPATNSALGPYSGGVLTPAVGRDLTDYNALSFWVRSDAPGTALNLVGFGNDNTGTSLYEVSRGGIPLTREWTRFVVPIPDASRLVNERGLFTFSEAAEATFPEGYDIWFDDIRFEKVDGLNLLIAQLANPSSVTRRYFVGSTVGTGGGTSVYNDGGGNFIVNHSARYFDFFSDDEGVAVPTDRGDLRIVGTGEAQVTAKLGDLDVRGSIRLAGYELPRFAGPNPDEPEGDVISLFSDVYSDDVDVSTWKADWEGVSTQLQDIRVDDNPVKMYFDMNYFGIEFVDDPVDAASKTHIHLDVYAVAGTQFEVTLESLTGVDTSETASVFLTSESTPAFTPGGWNSFDIPLEDFDVPENWDWSRVGRLILGASADVQLILLDNVYFYE